MRNIKWLSVVFAILSLTELTFAAHYHPLNYPGGNHFTSEDLALIKKNTEYTLSHAYDGEKVKWHNTNTGAAGYAMAYKTNVRQAGRCRELVSINYARGAEGKWRSVHTFCLANNHWRLVK